MNETMNYSLPVLKDSFGDFARRVNQFPLLNKEEELELIVRYREHGDKEAIQKLILCTLRYVIMRVSKFKWHKHIKDIVQEGILGLVQATEKFDISKNKRFSNYATLWIDAYVFNYLLKSSNILSGDGEGIRKIFYNLDDIINSAFKINDNMNDEEIIEHIAKTYDISYDMAKEGYYFILSSSKMHSLDDVYEEVYEDKDFVSDFIENDELDFKRGEIYEAMNNALLPREKEILQLTYLDEEPISQLELANKWGTTKQNIDRMKKNAISKIKKYLEIPA